MLEGLNFIILNVSDMEASTRFYTEKLGFEVEAASPGFTQLKASHPGAMLSLQLAEHTSPYQGVELWWQATQIDALYSQLVERGVEIASPPMDEPFGRALSIKDNEGNQLNMYQLPSHTGN